MAQSYVGKPLASKGIGGIIRRFVVSRFTPMFPSASGVRSRNSIDGCGLAPLLAEGCEPSLCEPSTAAMKPEGRIKPRSHRRNVPRRTVVATDGTRPVAGPHWWSPRRLERIADFVPKCSNPVRWRPGTRCDDDA
jgi:hypothetical protein